MSNRLSAVLPLCLRPRPAALRARSCSCSIQSKPNRVTIQWKHVATIACAAEPKGENAGVYDGSVFNTAGDTPPPISYRATQGAATGITPVDQKIDDVVEEFEQVQHEVLCQPNVPQGTDVIVQKEAEASPLGFSYSKWVIIWETLHNELLRIRQNENVREQWIEHHTFAKSLVGDLETSEFTQRWQAMNLSKKQQALPSLLAGSLAESAAQTLVVLDNLEILPKNFRIRMQCLRHIHLAYPHEFSFDSQTSQAFQREIDKLRPSEEWGRSMLIQHLDTLLTWSTEEQRQQITRIFFEYYPYAQSKTLLPLITSAARKGNMAAAVELFKKLPPNMHVLPKLHLSLVTHHIKQGDVDSALEYFNRLPQDVQAQPESLLPLITLCIQQKNVNLALEFYTRLPQDLLQNPTEDIFEARNHLIKHDTVTRTDTGSNFEILPQILALGGQPDASLHNAVLDAAVTNGVPEVAWDLYNYLKASDMFVDARSHLVLLRDAFLRRNVEAVNEIMTAIHADAELVKDPYLIAYSMNIVRNICYFERRTSSSEALSHIMALYDRAYDRAPLHKAQILQEQVNPAQVDTLPQPKPASLSFTIWSYILVQYSVRPVDVLWLRFMQLLSEGDADFLAAARLDIIFNAFMIFYARTPSSMVKSLQIMYYMLEHSHSLCRDPTARSWSILLGGFLRHKQVTQAQMVLQMMLSRGLKPEMLREEYMPGGASLNDLAQYTAATLDERPLPVNLARYMDSTSASSLASGDDDQMSSIDTLSGHSIGHSSQVWRGFVDLRPFPKSDDAMFAANPFGDAGNEK